MKTANAHGVRKGIQVLILFSALYYPGITASNADYPPYNKLFKHVAELSVLPLSNTGKPPAKSFKTRRNKTLNHKQTAVMYFLWFALKHNRPG